MICTHIGLKMKVFATFLMICSIMIIINASREDFTYLGELYTSASTNIPYIVPERQFTTIEKIMIDKAMKEIMKNTCIEFSPYNKVLGWSRCPELDDGVSVTNDLFSLQPQPRLLCFTKSKYKEHPTTCHHTRQGTFVVKGHVVYSKMGYINLGANPSCFTLDTLLHEIMHALGFDHEHQRPDRDNFVEIDSTVDKISYDNAIEIKHLMNTYGLPYDVCSITHYENMSGVRKLPNVTSVCDLKDIGLQHTLSTSDITKINTKYNCEPRPSIFGGFRPGSYLFKHFGNLHPSNELDVAIKICLLTNLFLIYRHHKIIIATLGKVSCSTIFLIQVVEAIIMALFYFGGNHMISNGTTVCQLYSAYYLRKLCRELFYPLTQINFVIAAAKASTIFDTSSYLPIQIEGLKMYIHKNVYKQKVDMDDSVISDDEVLDDTAISLFKWIENIILIVLVAIFLISGLKITRTLFMVIAPILEFSRDPVSSLYWCEDTRKFVENFYN